MATHDHNKSQQARLAPCHRRRKLRLTYMLIAVAACVVCESLAWAVQAKCEASSSERTKMNFALLSMSLTNYGTVYGHLPYMVRREPAAGRLTRLDMPNGTGRALYSWRVGIVPFLISWHGSWEVSEPWDSPANKDLLELSYIYAHDLPESFDRHPRTFPETNVLAITGPGTAFGDDKEPPKAVKDLPAGTIIVVETRVSAIPWPAPGDFDIRTMPQTINAPDGKGICGRHPGGFHVIFADGQVWFISDKVPFETLKKFFTVADAKKHDREKLLGPYALDRPSSTTGNPSNASHKPGQQPATSHKP